MPNCTYDEPPTWKSGIDTMFLSPSSKPQPSCAFTVCATTLACDSITPLGRPVVPEEYITRQTSSGSTASARPVGVAAASRASYSSPSAPSGVTSTMCSSERRSRIFSIAGRSSAPTTSTLAPQSLRTKSSSSPASRKLMIALAAPRDAAASVSSTPAGWFLSRNATTSPRPTPNPPSAPASRRIRSFHCAHVQDAVQVDEGLLVGFHLGPVRGPVVEEARRRQLRHAQSVP